MLDAPAQLLLQRATTEDGPYVPVSGVLDGRSGRSSFSHRDTDIEPLLQYYYRIAYLESGAGDWSYSAPVRVMTPGGVFRILGTRPNPARGGVQSVMFELDRSAEAWLEVYDAAGRRVRRVAQGPFVAGVNTVEWDGRAEDGRQVAVGVYWVRLRAVDRSTSAKIVVLR